MSNNQIYQIDLVNSEGPLLKLIKSKKSFIVVDEWKVQLATLSKEEVIDFIDGNFNLTDSHGRVWNYPKVSSGMRQKTEKILDFIQDRYQIDYVKFIAQFSKEYEIFDGDEELIRNIILFLESTTSLITKLN
jgi:hypothetical protein